MLLTSSQVSVLFSGGIIAAFTLALFLAGWVLQQQTLHSLQAEIKPRVARLHTRASASAAAAAAKSHLPTSQAHTPPATWQAPLAVIPQHQAQIGVAAPGFGAQDAKRYERASMGMAHDARVEASGAKWRSRERRQEEMELSKAQERFEKEGENFFSANKPRQHVGQAVFAGGGGRR